MSSKPSLPSRDFLSLLGTSGGVPFAAGASSFVIAGAAGSSIARAQQKSDIPPITANFDLHARKAPAPYVASRPIKN